MDEARRDAMQADRAARYAHERAICQRHEGTARIHLILSIGALAGSLTVFAVPIHAAVLWWFAAAGSWAYCYFVNRFLENLGTRYDLLPIVTRSRRFDAFANRPILIHIGAGVAFYAAWVCALLP
jgi:hypothetical protein